MKKSITIPERNVKIPMIKISWLHAVILILSFFLWRECSSNLHYSDQLSQNDKALNDTINHYVTKIGEQGASKLSLQGDKDALTLFLRQSRDSTRQMERLAKKYKRISAGVKSETITVIDSIEVPYIIDGPKFNIDFEVQEKYYSLSGQSRNDGLSINDLKIPNTQSIIIGAKKEGFFKRSFSVDVVNSNPYIKTTSIDSYVYSERKKRASIGVYAGYGISKNGLSPQIGIGVNYALIRF